jgi:CheY-like chemotaxis protein
MIRLMDVVGRTDSGNRILADLVSEAIPVTVRLDESAENVAALFEKHQLGEVVIFSADSNYVGLITHESVLHWSRQRLEDAESKLRQGRLAIEREERGSGEGEGKITNFPLPTRQVSALSRSDGPLVKKSALESPRDGAAIRILLVEDHEPSRLALRMILARRNFTVSEAGSLEEARKIAKREQFDVVISDIGLPDGSGYDLMSYLGTGSGLVGISVTASGGPSDLSLSKSAGFSHHFTKPLNIPALLETIHKIVAAKSAKANEAVQ